MFPYMVRLILDHHLSDHRLILLCEVISNYGPSSFRLFHSWFHVDGFQKVVENSRKNDRIIESNIMVSLKKKLRFFKKT